MLVYRRVNTSTTSLLFLVDPKARPPLGARAVAGSTKVVKSPSRSWVQTRRNVRRPSKAQPGRKPFLDAACVRTWARGRILMPFALKLLVINPKPFIALIPEERSTRVQGFYPQECKSFDPATVLLMPKELGVADIDPIS